MITKLGDHSLVCCVPPDVEKGDSEDPCCRHTQTLSHEQCYEVSSRGLLIWLWRCH